MCVCVWSNEAVSMCWCIVTSFMEEFMDDIVAIGQLVPLVQGQDQVTKFINHTFINDCFE